MHLDRTLERLFEQSCDPVFVIDPFENRFVAANGAGCAMLGYTHEELLATPVSHIHPADMPQAQELLERVLRDGHGSTIKLACRTKSGSFLPTEMSLLVFNSGGRVHILALVNDRSEHRQRCPSD